MHLLERLHYFDRCKMSFPIDDLIRKENQAFSYFGLTDAVPGFKTMNYIIS